MATSGINQLNKLRLMGMSSGMDTESIITQMMKIEQLKVDKQFQSKTKYEYKKNAYTDVNLQLYNFRTEFMSSINAASQAKNIMSSYNFKSFKVTSDDKNNSIGISVAPGSTALLGSNTVNAVARLATGASITSKGKVSADGKGIGSTNTKLKDLNLGTGIVGYNKAAVPPVLDGDGNVITPGKDAVVGAIAFTINGVEFNFTEEDTLQTVINTVNANAKANVTMSYSQLTDSLTVTSKTTGKDSSVIVQDKPTGTANGGRVGNFFDAFGIIQAKPGLSPDEVTKAKPGQDAILWINGERTTQSSNTFTIDGVTYNLKKTFGALEDETEADELLRFKPDPAADGVTFQISRDTDKAMDVIKGFIEGYNKLILSLTSLVTTRPDKKYPPLTDEQREALSETQQDKWDKLAKQGTLYNDSGINKILEDLRSTFFAKVGNTGMSLNDLGIGPGASVIDHKYVGTQQEIVIKDEDKLRKMLEENPDLVANLFMQGSTSKDAYNDLGIGGKIYKLTTAYESNVKKNTFDSLDRSIKDADKLLTSLKDKMSAKEELLYKKFAAMETALSKLQSQGNWFASQMGSR